MRILYLALAVFVLINIGATCRTAAPLTAGCESFGGGLVRCADSAERQRE